MTKKLSLTRIVKPFIKEIQQIANSKKLTFDVGTLMIISIKQFETYHSKKTNEKTLERKADYVCCKLNELLETMICFYGGRGKYGR